MSSTDPELIKHLVWRLARLLIRNAQLGAKLPHDRLTATVSDLKRQLKQVVSRQAHDFLPLTLATVVSVLACT